MKSRRCCCGKYTVDDGDRATVINDIGHEVLGMDGAFCGPVIRQDLRDLRKQNTKLIDIVKALRPFAWPEITRGPASKEWIAAMRGAQEALGFYSCFKCDGVGEGPSIEGGLCTCCYGTGLVDPKEW